MKRWTWYIAVAALCLGVAGTVEVHFESKDGGFFLKQIPRSYHLASSGAAGAGAAAAAGVGLGGTTSVVGEDQDNDEAVLGAGVGGGAGSVLSVDRFTVFQTAEPVSVRASYGPFSTKQTVPARYIVPDPVDQLSGSGQDAPLNISQLGVARHLDMSAHIVRADVARDQPVLRVLFHTGGEPARAARQHAARQQRVCIVLHASVPNRPPLSAACSPDGEDGVCLAQVTIPHTWWPPLPPLPPPEELTTGVSSGEGGAGPESAGLGLGLGKTPPRKAPPRVVQLAHSVLEPRGSEPGCVPRVQIQPVTPLGTATLVPARSAYRELRADERLTILLPHAPLYPMSRMHLPVFLQPRPNEPRVAVLIVKARVKPGMRILGAESSSDQWNVSVDMNPKHTVATVTALRRPPGIEEAGAAAAAAAAGPGQGQQDEPPQEQQDQAQQDDQDKQTMPGVSEVFSWLVEVGEDSADDDAYDGRIVWSVRYVLEGSPNNPAEEEEAAAPSEGGPATPEPWTSQQPAEGAADGDVADVAEAADLETGVVGDEQPQADGVAAMGGAAGGAVARARSPRSTHQHHQGHHGHHAGHQGGHQGHHGGHQAHQGHAERHQLHGELVEETRRKLVARFEVQKDDIQAVLPISKNWQLVNTAVLTGRQVSQAMKVFIVSQAGRVADVTLQSSCKTEDDSVLKVSSSCTSVYVDGSEIRGSSNGTVLVKYGTYTGMARFTVWMPQFPLEVVVQDYRLSQIKGWRVRDQDSSLSKSKRSAEDEVDAWDRAGPAAPSDRLVVEDVANSLDHDRDRDRQSSCRVRFQQSPVEVYARFKAEDHDSGRESFFVSRRTLLLVTDLVQSYMRVSDPRVATLHKRVVQGRSSGRTEVQVLSPITGRVIGSKEVRVVADKVSVSRLLVRVVSGLQLSITADSDIENGYVAETSVTRKLTAQYQEGLLDIDIEFSDGTRTPLRDVPVEDYHLIVDSLAPDIVAFAPMGSSASLHPRVIAVRQGRGDLLKVTLLSDELCRGVMRRSKTKSITSHVPLAVATAQVEINFAASDVAQRTEFVQNDGGSIGKDRKSVMSTDLRDILIGIPLQDENNHEPTVQARQHHSSGGGIGGGGGGVLGSIGHSMVSSGSRHHGNVHTTPLEIGMYVLLAAFCFAIVVFVVSCVVYASKFSPQSLDQMGQTAPQGLHGVGAPLSRGAAVSGLGAGVAMVKRQLQMQPQSRDSTTNVHDWVWLGRATLERGSGPGAGSGHLASATTTTSARSGPPLNINNNPVMHITTNPNYADPSDVTEEMELAIAECLSKPEERERERERALSAEPAAGPRIDSSTYCKKDRDRDRDRDRERPRRGDKRHHHHRAHKSASASAQEASGDCWKLTPPPPPLPAHGSSPEKVVPPRDEDPDYKPPVPPHRNIPLVKDLKDLKDDEPSAQPRRHHHHHHHNHHHNRNNSNNQCNKSNQKDQKRHATDEEDELPDPTFVEFPDASPGSTQLQGVSAEVKRANIVGNPMFSSTEEEDDEDDEEDQGEVQRVREELLGLDDLNMDYDQIMEYFDNLKESNA